MRHSIISGKTLLALAVTSVIATQNAQALSFQPTDELTIDWDTTVSYGAAWRMQAPDDDLLADINGDDGNRNFKKGSMINNRVSVISEADFQCNWRTTDETIGFNGSLEKYNWTLVSKQEMYVPYNNYKFENADVEMSELLLPGHANPEFMRYELHRVWVVRADLKENERNVYKTRVIYVDEDSWNPVTADQYDNRDNLWRTQLGLSINLFDVRGVYRRTFFYHDLVSREYFADGLLNYTTPIAYNKEPKAVSFFSAGTLRKMGVR